MDNYQKRYFNREIARRASKSLQSILFIAVSLKLIAIIVSLNVKTEAALEAALEASLAYSDNVPSSSNGTVHQPILGSSLDALYDEMTAQQYEDGLALGALKARELLAPWEIEEQRGSPSVSTMSTATTTAVDRSTSREDESSGESEFVCQGCGQSFKQAKYLRAHLNRRTKKCYDATGGNKYDLRGRK
jgi:hypothetical protein